MVSLRFPFSSFPPPINNASSRHLLTASFAVATCAGIAITHSSTTPKHPILQNTLHLILTHLPSIPNPQSPLWGCLSLSSDFTVTESKTGSCFPGVVKDSQTLLGIGLRRKSIFGLKNVDVYAFGIYANEDEVQKNLKENHGKFSASDLKENKDFSEELLKSDINMTVRLQIVYSRLSIRSVRNAFEESIGSRLQKFGGPDNKELLYRFTSQFKDDMKIPKGSVIELSRDHGHVLHTKIDGVEVGSIKSKLLCQSVLDLYIGEDPFDRQAKEHIMNRLATVFDERNSPDE
ncbi:Fatty-acid-binding protein 1 [Bienertia sinuspersici]